MQNTLERIKHYIDLKKMSVAEFERRVGMSNGSFASQLKNKKTIGVDKLENILKEFQDINPDWLLTGNGPITRIAKNTIQEPPEPYKSSEKPPLKEIHQDIPSWQAQGFQFVPPTFTILEEIEMRIISYTLAAILQQHDKTHVHEDRHFRVEACVLDAREYYRITRGDALIQ